MRRCRENLVYPIDHASNTAMFQALDSNYKVKIPLHPFSWLHRGGARRRRGAQLHRAAEFGGNMDAPEASAGNTVYLPVNVSGALFYFGDGHAAMGDGEIAGTAIEVPMKARLQFNVVKGKHTNWPRFENEKESWLPEPIARWMTRCALRTRSWWHGSTRTTASRNWMPTSCFRSGQGACYGDGGSELRGGLLPLRKNICLGKSKHFRRAGPSRLRTGRNACPRTRGFHSWRIAATPLRLPYCEQFSEAVPITSAIRATRESCPMPPLRWRSIIQFAGTSSSWLRESSGDVLRKFAFFAGVAPRRFACASSPNRATP